MAEFEDVYSKYVGNITSINGETLGKALEIAKRHRIDLELVGRNGYAAANDAFECYKKRVEYLESKKES